MEKSYTEGPLQTSRLGFFNLLHETLVILRNIKSFHPATDARGGRGATKRRGRERAEERARRAKDELTDRAMSFNEIYECMLQTNETNMCEGSRHTFPTTCCMCLHDTLTTFHSMQTKSVQCIMDKNEKKLHGGSAPDLSIRFFQVIA